MNSGLGLLSEDYDGYYDYDEFFLDGGGGGGGYYDPGYGGYGYFEPIDYAPYDPGSAWPIDEPGGVELPTFGDDPWFVDPGYSYSDPLAQWQDYYAGVAESALSDPLFNLQTSEPEQLPDVGDWPYFPLPYVNYNPWETPPYIPPVIEQPPPPPPLPPSPASQQPNLPPACPQGQYHPYPIGHSQQNVCVPFPAQQQAPKPQQQQQSKPPSSGSSGSKPQQQQQPKCPTHCRDPRTGQWFKTPSGYHCDPVTQACTPDTQKQTVCPSGQVRNPSTGQCVTVPACTTPGTVFDANAGRCVPFAQAQQPLCPPGYAPNFNTQKCEVAPTCAPGLEFNQQTGFCVTPASGNELDDFVANLKNVPWWIWLALGGAFLLSRQEEGRTTTVRYRRAS